MPKFVIQVTTSEDGDRQCPFTHLCKSDVFCKISSNQLIEAILMSIDESNQNISFQIRKEDRSLVYDRIPEEPIDGHKESRNIIAEDPINHPRHSNSPPSKRNNFQEERLVQPSRPLANGIKTRTIMPADVKYWTLTKFAWIKEIETINVNIFKNQSFRPNQRAIINATIFGKDIFALMPTGYGKSLCFQLPGVFGRGVTFVISPLLALIHDQVNQLGVLGVKTIGLHSNNDIELKICQILEDKEIKIVYTTPETLLSPRVFASLDNMHKTRSIERFVVDEAHCVSKWGNDFRKSYLDLRRLRIKFSKIPIQTFTATASKEVVDDVVECLGLRDVQFFKASFNRANLYIQVFERSKDTFKPLMPPRKSEALEKTSKSRNKSKDSNSNKKGNRLTKTAADIALMIRNNYRYASGIIYCCTKAQCDTLASFLASEFEGRIGVASYHAGKPEKLREKVLRQFMNDEISVVVATIAFGMGINKSDIRFVVHYNMPKTVEDYYQEIGRAGRDGRPAICTLFYDPSDKSLLDFFLKKDTKGSALRMKNKKTMLYKLMLFCEERNQCRRKMILEYFGENFSETECAGSCDNCAAKLKGYDASLKPVNFNRLVDLIIAAHNGKFTKEMTFIRMVDALKGQDRKKFGLLPYFGECKGLPDSTIRQILLTILEKGLFREKTQSSSFNKFISYELLEMVKKPAEDFNLELLLPREKFSHLFTQSLAFQLQDLMGKSTSGRLGFVLDYYNSASEKLRELRRNHYNNFIKKDAQLKALSEESNFTVESLIPATVLHDLCRILPQDKESLSRLITFPEKFRALEEAILKCCNEVVKEFGLKKEELVQIPAPKLQTEEPDVMEDEIFEISDLSFLNKEDEVSEVMEDDRKAEQTEAFTTGLDQERGDNSNGSSFYDFEEVPDLFDIFEEEKDLKKIHINKDPDEYSSFFL
jgi:superfamily II DNA helicase RecQ